MWNEFLSLIYPKTCPGCNEVMIKNEIGICVLCSLDLPKTNYCKDRANPVAKLFWGRLDLEIAISSYYFNKENIIQHLIHALKYKGDKMVGEILGVELGKDIQKVNKYKNIDVIIPVPIHNKKLKNRGYNQSLFIAKGVRKVINVPIIDEILLRHYDGSTQTTKSRFDRWKNVYNNFDIRNNNYLEYKHILLVDDVVTTGATIEACGRSLQSIKGVKLSVATLASADMLS